MAEEDLEVSGMVDKWVKLGRASVDEALSDVTRAKLAAELVLPPGRRRGGPCLRKLVLWTNLLGASSSLLGAALPTAGAPTGESLSSAAQAEYDWFEGVMDDIDASDSDSDSSEPGTEGASDDLPCPPPGSPRASGLRKRRRSLGSDDERARDGPVLRARRLCMALRGMRLLRRRHRLLLSLRRRRLPPAPAAPLAPAPETPPPTLQLSHPTTPPPCAPSLSRLLPTKTSFRFEPPPTASPSRATGGQSGIDFSRYEFLISTDDARTGMKYLVGMSTVRKRLVVKKVAVFVGLDDEREPSKDGGERPWKVFGLACLNGLEGIWRT